MKKIGIDIGGVIIEKDNTTFDSKDVKFVDDVLEIIASLAENHDLYIISFYGRKREQIGISLALAQIKVQFVKSRDLIISLKTQQVGDNISKIMFKLQSVMIRDCRRNYENIIPITHWTPFQPYFKSNSVILH